MRGLLINNITYVFDERVDQVAIVLKHSRNAVQKIITGVVLGMILVLMAIFILQAVIFGQPGQLIGLDFWQTPQFSLFCFWSALFLTLFLFLSRRRSQTRSRSFAKG